MIAARWMLTILFGLLWLLIATFNGWVAWRQFVRKEERAPSIAPFIGGFIAYVGFSICPWDSPQKYLYFWLALVLDVGSLPYLVLVIVGTTKGLIQESKEEEHFWKRKYMELSWAFKLALGFFGWLLFSVLYIILLHVLRIFDTDEAARQVAFWTATFIYWVAYAVLYSCLRKYKPVGKDHCQLQPASATHLRRRFDLV